MNTIYRLTALFALTLSALGADVKFSALPTATSPSTNSYIPIIDLDLLPAAQNQKYLLTNLATVAQVNAATNGFITGAQVPSYQTNVTLSSLGAQPASANLTNWSGIGTNAYVVKAGDTMTGTLTVPNVVVTNAAISTIPVQVNALSGTTNRLFEVNSGGSNLFAVLPDGGVTLWPTNWATYSGIGPYINAGNRPIPSGYTPTFISTKYIYHGPGINVHTFGDKTVWGDDANGLAMASYDAYPSVGAGTSADHYVAFQSRPVLDTKSIGTYYGLYSTPQMNACTNLINSYGIYLVQPTQNFAATQTNQNNYGVYVGPMDQGKVSNYGLYIAGPGTNLLGGTTVITNTANTDIPLTVMAKAGTTNKVARFGAGGTNFWYVMPDGSIQAATDNAYDIGGVGVFRPKNLYLAGSGVAIGDLLAGGSLRAGGTGLIYWNSGSVMDSVSDGSVRIRNSSQAVLGKIQVGVVEGGYTKVCTSAVSNALFYVSVPSTNMIGGRVLYTVNSTDGTDAQQITGTLQFGAVGKATAVTANVTDVQNTSTVSAGTLTATLTANVSTNNVFALMVTPTTSLTTTNLTVKWKLDTTGTHTFNAL